MERKATDVILDIEKKLDLLLEYYKTADFNQKLILSKLAALEKSILNVPVLPPIVKSSATVEAFTAPSFVEAKLPTSPPSRKILVATPVNNIGQASFDEQGEPEVLLDLKPSKRRDQRPAVSITPPASTAKTTSVQQRIAYPDGKNVILANVEIFDLSGQLVKKTKTNSAGKWSAVLAAGTFKIHISKGATSEKPAVEYKLQVEIPLSDSPLELASPQ